MTTSIPYSFVPGTKAMASEVNANFLALANTIDDDKTYFNNQINSVKSDLEDLSSEARAGLDLKIDKTLLNGGIIEVPDPMYEIDGNTLTIKAGLKVMMPDGLNADGSLKSIIYTVENDIVYTETSLASNNNLVLFLHSSGVLASALDYFVQDEQPTIPYSCWHNTKENVIYGSGTDGNIWTRPNITTCCLGHYDRENGQILAFRPFKNIELLKANDYKRIVSWGFPDYKSTFQIGSGYSAPENGWIMWFGGQAGDSSSMFLWINGMQIGYHYYYKNGDNYSVLYPIYKNDTVTFTTGNGVSVHFIKCRGI